jgi:hypothetical protein
LTDNTYHHKRKKNKSSLRRRQKPTHSWAGPLQSSTEARWSHLLPLFGTAETLEPCMPKEKAQFQREKLNVISSEMILTIEVTMQQFQVQ